MEKPSIGMMAAYFAGLWVLGIAGFVLLGWVGTLRDHRSVTPLPPDIATSAQSTPPLTAMTIGLRALLEACRTNLQNGRRSDAMHALNGAKHIGEIGRSQATTFEDAARAIRDIRRVIENGNPAAAPDILDKAIAALRGTSSSSAVAAPPDIASYDGATVLNALGLRIGQVESANAENVQLNLGNQNILGFLDLGGKPISVRVNRLVFGKKKSIGPTMICLPIFAHAPNKIVQQR